MLRDRVSNKASMIASVTVAGSVFAGTLASAQAGDLFDTSGATWSHSGYLGNMTGDKVEGLFEGPDFLDNYLLG